MLQRPLESALGAVIGVDNASWFGLAVADGHVEGVDNQRRVLFGVDRPAHDPTGVRIEDCSTVEPTFPGPVLRDVGDPQLVRS